MTKRKTIDELFKGRHFEQETIILCVRWYLRYKLSSRDLVEIMAERGLTMSHTTILLSVQRFVPEFEKHWNRYAAGVCCAWRVDETYVKVNGQWVYLYRAVDREGRTVEFRLSPRRNVAAAKAFLRKACRPKTHHLQVSRSTAMLRRTARYARCKLRVNCRMMRSCALRST
jgi:transposase-like protein